MSVPRWDREPSRIEDQPGLKISGHAVAPEGEVTYKWVLNGSDYPEPTEKMTNECELAIPPDQFTSDKAGSYKITPIATVKGEEKSGTTVSIAVEPPAEPTAPSATPAPLVWDKVFSGQVLVGVLALGSVILVAAAVWLGQLGPRLNLAWSVAILLVVLAAWLALAGVAIGLLELRGKASGPDDKPRGFGADVAAKLPEILKNWATLGVTSALLFLSGIALICATTLAYRSLPDPSATSTATATATASGSPSTASSAATPSPGATK